MDDSTLSRRLAGEKGGARGDRRPKLPHRRRIAATRRTHRLALSLRLRERAELERIGEAWGVPASTVAWAFVHEALRRCRRLAPEYGGVEGGAGLGLAAGVLARLLPDLATLVEARRAMAPGGQYRPGAGVEAPGDPEALEGLSRAAGLDEADGGE